jgi:hypothetical protein
MAVLDDDALGRARGDRLEEAVAVAVAVEIHAGDLVDVAPGGE